MTLYRWTGKRNSEVLGGIAEFYSIAVLIALSLGCTDIEVTPVVA